MLLNVHVKDLALIEDVDICFGDGLNILTGETGAGKSIIIGSIGIALGAKAGRDLIRNGADYALVELVFSIDSEDTKSKLKEMDINIDEDNQIIISRKIMNGKSIIKVNGETTTASMLREIASLVIDVHGQHDYESLVHTEKHLEILDSFAGENNTKLKNETEVLYKEYKRVLKELSEFTNDEEQRARDLSFFEFELNEIEAAGLKTGEDEELEEEFKLMSHGRKIAETLSEVYNRLTGDNVNVSEMVGLSMKELSSISHLDERVGEFYETLGTIDSLCYELSKDMTDYLNRLDFNPERVEYVSDRLDTINKLKLKHGKTIEAILQKKENLSEKIDSLNNYEETRKQLETKLSEIKDRLEDKSCQLSMSRKKAATTLEKDIKKALMDLNFLEVKFKAEFSRTSDYTAKGTDEMEFMISTNPGEDIKPLAKIASGGELSRIMLGLKAVLADKDSVDTLIFDEIDTGISGKTAGMVADKMSVISSRHQVICITHLPQIAAHADRHYLIEKNVKNNHTFTDIRRLNEEESVEELARMLGSTVITEATLDNARELKNLAGKGIKIIP